MFANSTYSKVNLDFLLAINSYSTEDFSLLQESSAFIQCFPCGAGTATNADTSGGNNVQVQRGNAVMRDLAIANAFLSNSPSHTLQSTISSQSFTFTEAFDLAKLRYLFVLKFDFYCISF